MVKEITHTSLSELGTSTLSSQIVVFWFVAFLLLSVIISIECFPTLYRIIPFVSDFEFPRFENLPENKSVISLVDQAYAIVNWTEPSATDKCGVITLSSSINPGSKFSIGTTFVTYTAENQTGYTVVDYTFAVTVKGSLMAV